MINVPYAESTHRTQRTVRRGQGRDSGGMCAGGGGGCVCGGKGKPDPHSTHSRSARRLARYRPLYTATIKGQLYTPDYWNGSVPSGSLYCYVGTSHGLVLRDAYAAEEEDLPIGPKCASPHPTPSRSTSGGGGGAGGTRPLSGNTNTTTLTHPLPPPPPPPHRKHVNTTARRTARPSRRPRPRSHMCPFGPAAQSLGPPPPSSFAPTPPAANTTTALAPLPHHLVSPGV